MRGHAAQTVDGIHKKPVHGHKHAARGRKTRWIPLKCTMNFYITRKARPGTADHGTGQDNRPGTADLFPGRNAARKDFISI